VNADLMPPKRKTTRSNKKKKGSQAKGSNSNINAEEKNSIHLLPKLGTKNATSAPNDKDVGAHYQQYKQATQTVLDGLRALVPSSFRLTTVNDLVRASNYILDASINVKDSIISSTYTANNIQHENSSSSDEDAGAIALDRWSQEEEERLIKNSKHVIVPNHLIASLEMSITVRSKVMEKYKADGSSDDVGHDYMIHALKRCKIGLMACRRTTNEVRKIMERMKLRKKQILRFSKDKGLDNDGSRIFTDGNANSDHDNSNDRLNFTNQFAPLYNEYEEDFVDYEYESESKNEIEEIINERKQGVDSFAESHISEETDVYTIEQDLIKGSDRLQACSFLHTMEELMALVAKHYQLLKANVSTSESTDSKMLMQCAMVANTCMYAVQRAEAALAIDYPYLSNIYNVIVVVFLPCVLVIFERDILSSAPDKIKQKCDKATLVHFIGEIVSCSFYSNGGGEQISGIVDRFSKKTGLDRDEVKKISCGSKTLADLAIHSIVGTNMPQNMNFPGLGLKSYNWLHTCEYIGGDRSILSTLRWLQCVIHLSQEHSKLISIPGYFGTMWSEDINPATSIQGDLDELFCGSILPELIEWCKPRPELPKKSKKGPTSVSILDAVSPYTPQTIPLLHMLRHHMKERKNGPVSASLAFGMHCLLTSIIEMQGQSDVARHALNAKQSWNQIFNNLEQQIGPDATSNHYSFFINLERYSVLRCLAEPIGQASTECSSQMAFFNPLMAGSYLLFANYVIGLDLGSCTIDSIGQLRCVLHMYNAFKKTGLVDDIALVQEVSTVFRSSKPVWVLKDQPEQGEFCKRFLLSWGFTPIAATHTIKHINSSSQKIPEHLKNDCRKLLPIQPEDFSTSYRLIMKRDFSDVDDNNSFKNLTSGEYKRNEMFLKTLSNVNMTRDAMDDDEDHVCFTDWTQVGCVFNEFILALMKELGWDKIAQKAIRNRPDHVRNGVGCDGTRARGKFAVSNVNLEYQAYCQFIYREILYVMDKNASSAVGKKAAKFMKDYFSGVNKNIYCFYIDTPKHNTTHNPSHSDARAEELQSTSVSKLKRISNDLSINISGCLEKKRL